MLKRHFLFSAILLALSGSMSAYAQSEYPPGPPPGYRRRRFDRHHDDDRQVARAVYGTHGRYADVTEIVRHFARTREPFQVSNETFGVDPYRGKRKHLRVTIVAPTATSSKEAGKKATWRDSKFSVSPGPFATEMNSALIQNPELNQQFLSKIPLGRWGRVEEIGRLALYLCSEDAGFITERTSSSMVAGAAP